MIKTKILSKGSRIKQKFHQSIINKTKTSSDHGKISNFVKVSWKKCNCLQRIADKTQLLANDCRKNSTFSKGLQKNATFGKESQKKHHFWEKIMKENLIISLKNLEKIANFIKGCSKNMIFGKRSE